MTGQGSGLQSGTEIESVTFQSGEVDRCVYMAEHHVPVAGEKVEEIRLPQA